MREKVIIIGGGVAGLTAAHELIERDFEVHVFERREYLGGKAASVPVPASASSDSALPGEHGFRFFPGWYQHLPDTLKRIPYQGSSNVYRDGTVYDNLVTISTNLLTWSNREPVPLPLRAPSSLGQLSQASGFLEAFGRLGFTSADVAHFVAKLAAFLGVPEDKRVERFEQISWWDYLGCEERSPAFQDLIRATTRSLIAAKAEEVSAYTMGRLATRTLLDTLSTVDRVLNGPTNTVWIEPWRKYLHARGVKFFTGRELESVNLFDDKNEIESVSFQPFTVVESRRARRALNAVRADLDRMRARFDARSPLALNDLAALPLDDATDQIRPDDVTEMQSLVAELERDVESAKTYLHGLSGSLAPNIAEHRDAQRATEGLIPVLNRMTQLLSASAEPAGWTALRNAFQAVHDHALAGVAALDDVEDAAIALEESPVESHNADYFIFALPLEQMAYYVNRSPSLTRVAPELRSLRRLSGYLDWMCGIQFYLQEQLEISDGHIVCLDSEWSLTAIEQTKHWHDVAWPADVKAILSVDIARWDRRGRFLQKEPYNCTPDEIALEVWKELEEQLNRRSILLRKKMLRWHDKDEPGFERDYNFHLDNAVVDLRDRKKQAFYERARGLRFSASEQIEEANADDEPVNHPYMWGQHRDYNVEPLLVNRVGSRRLRPQARTGVRNMFLAGDYLLTETDLACMEGANEAARRAANGVLDAAGSRAERCRLWNLSAFGEVGRLTSLFSAANLVRTANRGVMDAVKSVRDRIFQGIGQQIVEHRKQRLER